MDVCRRPCLCIEKMFAHLFLPRQERSCVKVRFQTSTKTNPTCCCKITRQLVWITIISYTYIEYIWINMNEYDTWWLIKILLPIKHLRVLQSWTPAVWYSVSFGALRAHLFFWPFSLKLTRFWNGKKTYLRAANQILVFLAKSAIFTFASFRLIMGQ